MSAWRCDSVLLGHLVVRSSIARPHMTTNAFKQVPKDPWRDALAPATFISVADVDEGADR